MSLTNRGRDHFASGVIGGAVTAFNNANSYTAVGTSATAFAAAQTDLQGTSGFRKAMDGGYPIIVSGNVLIFQSTFATADANFDWQEWGIANASATGVGVLLNRKAEALGTKTSAQTWQIQTSLTVNNP